MRLLTSIDREEAVEEEEIIYFLLHGSHPINNIGRENLVRSIGENNYSSIRLSILSFCLPPCLRRRLAVNNYISSPPLLLFASVVFFLHAQSYASRYLGGEQNKYAAFPTYQQQRIVNHHRHHHPHLHRRRRRRRRCRHH